MGVGKEGEEEAQELDLRLAAMRAEGPEAGSQFLGFLLRMPECCV